MAELPEGRLQFSFVPVPPNPAHEVLRVEEAEAVLAALTEEFEQLLASQPAPVVLAARRKGGVAGERAAWEQALREQFVSKYGPPLLPMPEVLERSRLYMALKLSPRYMAPGVREAAQAMFKSPVFRASVVLSMLVYLVAWTAPEPFFSKTFAAALTVRLAMVVSLMELRNVALACLQL